jgi:hypothetical protein
MSSDSLSLSTMSDHKDRLTAASAGGHSENRTRGSSPPWPRSRDLRPVTGGDGCSVPESSMTRSGASVVSHDGFGMVATESGSIVGCVLGSAPPVDCPMPVVDARVTEGGSTVETRAG